MAWYDPSRAQPWTYAEAKGVVFGLCAAVVGFNRWPALMTAIFRRIMAGMGTNYFDDFCPLSLLCDSVSARNGLTASAAICGGSFGTSKTNPPGTQKSFIGVYVKLDQVALTGEATFQPREDCILAIQDSVLGMLSRGYCSAGRCSRRSQPPWPCLPPP